MADVHPIKTAAETALAEAFGAEKDRLPGSSAIRSLREAAFEAFDAKGLPHRRVEEWKYTDLRVLMRDVKPLARQPDDAALQRAGEVRATFAPAGVRRLTLVDGVLVAALSDLSDLPEGLRITALSQALASGGVDGLGALAPADNAALSLNSAFMSDGAIIDIADGVAINEPLHLAIVHSGQQAQAIYARSLIRVGAGASVTLIETCQGPAGVANQTNTALELHVGDGAKVQQVKIQAESLETLHLSTLMARIGANAELHCFTLSIGSAVARSQLFVTYAGENARATLAGATLLAGRRHSDTTLVVDHAVPGGESRELYKAVVDGEARSVFQGKIIVRPHAQKTDGRMMSQSLLLSDGGEVNNKPELEIFADDVQCAHGATCGQLDEDLLFYLSARGLPQAEAERLLVQAFVGEAIETVDHEPMRDILSAVAEDWLGRRA